jgi:DNA polymerase III delta prime subunit
VSDRAINQTVVGDHNIFTAAGNIHVVYELPPSDAEDRRNLLVLLERVERFWIKDVFEGTVKPATSLMLGKKTAPDAVEHPWKMMLGSAGQITQEISSDKNIADIFDETGRLLLILGEPGSGKTTTLLELTRSLIASALINPTKPIPVVFLLSSWSEKRQTIYEWLVEELKTKYYIPPRSGRSFLNSNRLIPLLDGLDEVSVAHQSACVDAIKRFARDVGTPGLVVSCRLNEYRELSSALAFNGAIHLQPLSIQQIDKHLEKRGEEQAALRTLLNDDLVLQELAASPLMLDVMATAYQNLPIEMLRDDRLNTANARRENVFQTYVTRMFDRTGKNNQPFSREQTLAWLSFLAKKMTVHAQGIFLIERIQPSWLSSRMQLLAYLVISRTAAGLLLGLPLMILHLAGSEPIVERIGASICILLWTFTMGFLAAFPKMWQSREAHKNNGVEKAPSRLRIFFHVLIHIFVGGLMGGLLAGIAGLIWLIRVLDTVSPGPDSIGLALRWYVVGQSMPGSGLGLRYFLFVAGVVILGMFFGWCYGLLFGLVIGVRDKKRSLRDDVQTAETIGWSSERAKKAVKRVFFWVAITNSLIVSPLLLAGFLLNVVLFLYYRAPFFDFIKSMGLTVGIMLLTFVFLTLFLTFSFGSIGALLRGLNTGSRVVIADLSNPGIKSSLKKSKYKSIYKSIYAGIIVGIVLGLLDLAMKLLTLGLNRSTGSKFGIQQLVLSELLISSVVLLFTNGMLAFLWYGGLDIIKHYCLRLILFLKGDGPRRFDSFLDYVVKLGFMYRVGGGYIFFHSMLRDYFEEALTTRNRVNSSPLEPSR